jgi:hypothetical protein
MTNLIDEQLVFGDEGGSGIFAAPITVPNTTPVPLLNSKEKYGSTADS